MALLEHLAFPVLPLATLHPLAASPGIVSPCYNLFMGDTQASRDYLAAVERAAAKLQRAEKAREEAREELVTAVRAAEAAKLRPSAILRASRLARATYYRALKGR